MQLVNTLRFPSLLLYVCFVCPSHLVSVVLPSLFFIAWKQINSYLFWIGGIFPLYLACFTCLFIVTFSSFIVFVQSASLVSWFNICNFVVLTELR